MLKYVGSDITEVTKGIVVHGVNCQGVMGSGVALAIRKKWPVVFDCYERNTRAFTGAEAHKMLGSAHIIRLDKELWVANCYTQLNFGKDKARYADPAAIRQSLAFAFSTASIEQLPIHTVKIGSDRGGLDWATDVLPIFEDLNNEYGDVNVIIHSL